MKLPKVDNEYGAPMGRPDNAHPGLVDEPMKFYLGRVRLNSGGYDSGGAYWGHGAPLYWAQSDDVSWFLRGSRDSCKAQILARYPLATFYR
jgi:hypothetical protein